MTAKVYRDRESGFYRAVCRNDSCRAANSQRNYWRTGHMSGKNAKAAAEKHNRDVHGQELRADLALAARPTSGPVNELGRARMTASTTSHGYVAYSRGCRCAVCREAARLYRREQRARRLATNAGHGRRAMYDAGCRCIPCCGARAAALPRERVAYAAKHAAAKHAAAKQATS